MIDMHSHILPNIDDGAVDMAMSLSMLRMAEAHGTTVMVATPHVIEGEWLPQWAEIEQKCRELQAAARSEGLAIAIYPGAEVAIHLDMLQHLKAPGPYCINGKNYILVELPSHEIPNYTEEFFFTLQARGMNPILAHAERHPQIMKNPEILVDWMQHGLLVQMNAPSLMGKVGEKPRQTAETLLYSDMVTVAGSDAHSDKTRRPILSEAADWITDKYGKSRTDTLFQTNPLAILDGRELPLTENMVLKPFARATTQTWWNKLKSCFG